jgi:hypothetical protein
MTFWSIVGHASFHTALGIGPSTMERSKLRPGRLATEPGGRLVGDRDTRYQIR